MAGKRFYFFCSCLIASSNCLIAIRQVKAVEDPILFPDSTVSSATRIIVNSTVGFGALKAHRGRKRWINAPHREKERFVNAYRFLRSLMVSILFAWCVVMSGTGFSVASTHYVVKNLFPLPVSTPLIMIGMLLMLSAVTPVWYIYKALGQYGNFCTMARAQKKKEYRNRNSAPTGYNPEVIHFVMIIDLVGCVSLAAVILMLLLKSGDVEPNPGPRDRNTDSSNQVSSPDSEESIEGVQPEGAQSLSEENTERRANASSGLLEVDHLASELGGFTTRDPTDKDVSGDTEQIPNPSDSETKTLVKESLPLKNDSTTPVNSDTSGLSYQPTSSDNNEAKFYLPTFQSDKPLISHRSGSVATLEQFSATSINEKEQVQEAIGEWRKKSDVEKLSCCQTFDEVLIKMFVSLGKLYRDGKTYDLCPLCLEKKKEVRQSHIIPLCILVAFRCIHVPVRSFNRKEDHRILYNFSRWTRFPPRKATVELLCETCETKCSVDENMLKSVYLCVMSNPGIVCQLADVKYRNLHHILAHILLRGILVNVDMNDCGRIGQSWFEDEDFKHTFTSLWNYCRDSTHPNPPDIRLFLLPNKAFNDETTFSMFSMERILRSPHYTEIVDEKEGVFFYTKFDCFNVVLPINEVSKNYFSTYRNGLYVDLNTEDVFLRQCVRPRRPPYGTFNSEELTSHFPAVLLRWNIQLHDKYADYLFNQPSKAEVRDYDIPFNVFPGELHVLTTSDTDTRMNYAADLAEKAELTDDLVGAKRIDVFKQDDNKATEDATKISPLTVVMISKGEFQQLRQIRAELMKKENMLELSTEENKQLREKNHILLKKIEFEMSAQDELKHKLLKETVSCQVSEISLQTELFVKGKRTKKFIMDLKKLYADAYDKLSLTAYKDKHVWKDAVDRKIEETKEILDVAKDLHLEQPIIAECKELYENFKKLRLRRMHSC